MKKPVNILSFVALFFFATNQAHAKLKVPIGSVQQIEIAADLPDTDEYRENEGSASFLEIARIHEEYIVAWLPVWVTQEPKLVLAVKDSETYYELPEAEMDKIIADNKLNKDDLLSIGFFSRFGGKAIVLALVGLVVWGIFSRNKK